MTTKIEIVNAIQQGLAAPTTGTRSGCGRAYVCLSKKSDRTTLKLFKEAAKAVGLLYLNKAYGVGDRAIYVGYDNADGRALAQAEAIAKNLRNLGLDVYDDAMSD